MLRQSSRGLALGKPPLWLKSLLLPSTLFLPKIPKGTERKELIEKTSKSVYLWQHSRPGFSQEFTLHDGPPYANGDLHLGHALNKILKDIINRFELIHKNSKVNYKPGWDCHGLPIEMKAVQDAGAQSPAETRRLCRELANSMIEKQRQQFQDFAIMADFDDPYVTMTHDYESKQLLVFLKLFENGLLTRQLKPVWWGCETQTALAEAELEYNAAHRSTAVFVTFPLTEGSFTAQYGDDIKLVIWTSTPWTMPANKAICVHRDIDYTFLHNAETGERLVVAVELAEGVAKLNPSFQPTEAKFKGSDLIGQNYSNPSIISDEIFPILHGDHVSATAGTGLVHTAPAHGMEDFLIGKQNGLHVQSLVDGKGLYEHVPPGFEGLLGQYANGKAAILQCLELLGAHNMVFHVNRKFVHSYPYDWRSKTPVIQRATPQWFVNVEKIKSIAEEALDNVEFIPEAGKNRLVLFIRNRSEWCISRQRTWGVPLPIVYHKGTHEPLDDKETVRHVVAQLGHYGTDAWFEEEADIARWLPDNLKHESANYYKGKDTMDVWFDSGTLWATLAPDFDALTNASSPPADIYLEGSDQHRGWFQSSLLNKIIASGTENGYSAVAPYRKIITHGFTLDLRSAKMSKSLGNIILPMQVIEGGGKPLIPALGTDGLRLWVASSNYTLDVHVNFEVLLRVLENVKKLRVTFKYLLGNLQDFAPVDDLSLSPLDRWVLSRLHAVQKTVVGHYETHNFARAMKAIHAHTSELSALYLDVCKDCLYTHGKDLVRRQAVQTVLDRVLRTYIGLLAPVQPLLVQEAWDLYAEKAGRPEPLPFMVPWLFYEVPQKYVDEKIEKEFDQIWSIRDGLYKHMEILRANGDFKNKLEAEVFIAANADMSGLLSQHSEYLDDYFLVSRVTVVPEEKLAGAAVVKIGDEENVSAVVAPSSSCKCPRCWKFVAEVEDHLCSKCSQVIQKSCT